MSGDFEAKVFGLQECRAALLSVVPKLRNRLLRNVLAAGGRVYRNEAKRLTPLLRVATKNRKPGTVRDAIRVRTSKRATARGDVGVFVNVQPAKGAKYASQKRSLLGVKFKVRVLKRASQRGANSKNDPFYWRFLEFGTKKLPAFAFLGRAVDKTAQAVAVINTGFVRVIDKLNQKGPQ